MAAAAVEALGHSGGALPFPEESPGARGEAPTGPEDADGPASGVQEAGPRPESVLAGPTGPAGGPSGFADLGSGGGVPALVLLQCWPSATAVLVEAAVRRAAFLRQAASDLGWADRVEVLEERAELAGRRPALRSRMDLVTARSFGRPALTAECAAPLLRPGGLCLVSEPPGDQVRWPQDPLAELGIRPLVRLEREGFHFQVLQQVQRCKERYPRRTGVPERRPLF